MKISQDCVFCGACELECPNAAITPGADTFEIDPERCTECLGVHAEPQCRLVCPADAIGPDLDNVETYERLAAKRAALAQ
jgi:ferredoxin